MNRNHEINVYKSNKQEQTINNLNDKIIELDETNKNLETELFKLVQFREKETNSKDWHKNVESSKLRLFDAIQNLKNELLKTTENDPTKVNFNLELIDLAANQMADALGTGRGIRRHIAWVELAAKSYVNYFDKTIQKEDREQGIRRNMNRIDSIEKELDRHLDKLIIKEQPTISIEQ